jgi:hypothetical protein
MTANNSPSRTVGWLAIATGGVILIGDVCLMLFFTIGGFFGTFNDLCVAFAAILNAWCELHGEDLSGRCPRIRVGLPTSPEGKGADSTCSI